MVPGARIGLIDLTANKLYVAGSATTTVANDCLFADLASCSATNNGGNNVQDGWFTAIDLTAGTASVPIRIGNGVKRWIRNINGIFWVASLNCGVESCVTLVNPIAGTTNVLPNANGDATGISLTAINGNSTTMFTPSRAESYTSTTSRAIRCRLRIPAMSPTSGARVATYSTSTSIPASSIAKPTKSTTPRLPATADVGALEHRNMSGAPGSAPRLLRR